MKDELQGIFDFVIILEGYVYSVHFSATFITTGISEFLFNAVFWSTVLLFYI